MNYRNTYLDVLFNRNIEVEAGRSNSKSIGYPGWFSIGYTGDIKTAAKVHSTFSISNTLHNPFIPVCL